MTSWRPHRDRAALARIALARYSSPYPQAVALIRIDGGDAFAMVSVEAVAEACTAVAEREELLADLAGEPA